MKLRLYVEDSYYQAYEGLAKKWLKTRRLQYREVKASKLRLNKMRDEMLKYVEFAHKDGFTCVVFILDQETPQNSLAAEIRASFKTLCKILPNHPTLRDMKVWLVVVKNSLESWLLAEAEAITRFASKTTKYRAKQNGNTELMTPNEAIKKITHILNQVENSKRGKRGKRRKRRKYEKSEAPDIVKYMSDDLSIAAKRNRSLKYFLRAVTCQQSGCHDR